MRSTASAGAGECALGQQVQGRALRSGELCGLEALRCERHPPRQPRDEHADEGQNRDQRPCEPSEVGDSLLQLRAGFGQLIGNDDAAFESVTERRPDERDLPHLIREPVQHIRDVCSRVDEIGAVLPVLENL